MHNLALLLRALCVAIVCAVGAVAAAPAPAAVLDDFDRFSKPAGQNASGDVTVLATQLGDIRRLLNGPGTLGGTVDAFWDGASALRYGANVADGASASLGVEYFSPERFGTFDLSRHGDRLVFHFDEIFVRNLFERDATALELSVGWQIANPPGSTPPLVLVPFKSVDLGALAAAGKRTAVVAFAAFEQFPDFDPSRVNRLFVTISSSAPAGSLGGLHEVGLDRITVAPIPGALPLFATAAAGLGLWRMRRRIAGG
jgi:hypothetical protein